MTLYSAIITLILVMDPLGNIPFFLSILSHVPPAKRRRIILRETFIAFLIMVFFLFFGQRILVGMHISEPALQISGGIILFLIALKMIFPGHLHEDNAPASADPLIVPLAIPLIAGPSTLAMIMVLANQARFEMLRWLSALTIAWLITTGILLCADSLRKLLGENGLTALERLMGMILTTMAVQMLLNGFDRYFHL